MRYKLRTALYIRNAKDTLRDILLGLNWSLASFAPEGLDCFVSNDVYAVKQLLTEFELKGEALSGLLTIDDEVLGAIEPQARSGAGLWIQRSLAAFLIERGAVDSAWFYDPRPTDLKEPLLFRGKSMRVPQLERFARLSPFFGREDEIKLLTERLAYSRFVTVIGAPGIGKTALLRVIQDDLGVHFSDGIWSIDVSQVASEFLLFPVVARTIFGAENAHAGHAFEQSLLFERIGQSHSLLVLDNCEHLAGAIGALATLLLSQCPNLTILVGSRVVVKAVDQTVITLGPLKVPEELEDTYSLQIHSAIALFVDRAQNADPHFELDSENASAVVAICQKLDGNPMAIELAAKKLSFMTPTQLYHRLGDRLIMFRENGDDEANERQGTLLGAVKWSYDLLSPGAQTLLQRLSWMDGAIHLEAVQQVVRSLGLEAPTLEISFGELVDHSFLFFVKEQAQAKYFQLPETQRMFGRHLSAKADWVPTVLSDLNHHIEASSKTLSSLEMELVYPDIRSTLIRLIRQKEWIRASELVLNTFYFWWDRGFGAEGGELVEELLSAIGKRRFENKDRLYNVMAYLAALEGDKKRHESFARKALASSFATQNQTRILTAMLSYGKARRHSSMRMSILWHKRTLRLAEASGLDEYITLALQSLSLSYGHSNADLQALKLLGRYPSLVARDSNLRSSMANHLICVGAISDAVPHLREAVFALPEETNLLASLGIIETLMRFCMAHGMGPESAVLYSALERFTISFGYLFDSVLTTRFQAYREEFLESIGPEIRTVAIEIESRMTFSELIEYCKNIITGI